MIAVRSRSTFLCLPLGIGCYFVYQALFPISFDLDAMNHRFFGSDGEYIVRHYLEGIKENQADHLLYHAIADLFHGQGTIPPAHVVELHRYLSASSGAILVSLAFLFVLFLGGGLFLALALALLLGGNTSVLYFSSTVETFLPSLLWGFSACFLTLRLVQAPRSWLLAVALGTCLGLAFLFRSDGILFLFLIVLLPWRSGLSISSLTALLLGGICVGGLGYMILAWSIHDVPPSEILPWLFGSMRRPQVLTGQWGSFSNFTPDNLSAVFINHVLFSILPPEPTSIRRFSDVAHYHLLAWPLVLALVALIISGLCSPSRLLPPSANPLRKAAMLWFFPHLLFALWLGPHEPFLFSILNTPALWLLCCRGGLFLTQPFAGKQAKLRTTILVMLCLGLWAHNLLLFIFPLASGQIW